MKKIEMWGIFLTIGLLVVGGVSAMEKDALDDEKEKIDALDLIRSKALVLKQEIEGKCSPSEEPILKDIGVLVQNDDVRRLAEEELKKLANSITSHRPSFESGLCFLEYFASLASQPIEARQVVAISFLGRLAKVARCETACFCFAEKWRDRLHLEGKITIERLQKLIKNSAESARKTEWNLYSVLCEQQKQLKKTFEGKLDVTKIAPRALSLWVRKKIKVVETMIELLEDRKAALCFLEGEALDNERLKVESELQERTKQRDVLVVEKQKIDQLVLEWTNKVLPFLGNETVSGGLDK